MRNELRDYEPGPTRYWEGGPLLRNTHSSKVHLFVGMRFIVCLRKP